MTSDPPQPSRRQLLAAGGAVASGLVLGACTADPRPEPAPSEPSPAGIRFPDGFAFGTATAAYQIEGSVTADGRGPSIWDTFTATPGNIDDGSSGAVACDHYRRWESDLDLMAALGAGSYRFSVAWSRVIPQGRGRVNAKGLDFYRRLVDGLEARGIAAVATLYHWDLPQALQDLGGWERRACADWFADYAATVFDALDGVGTWLTFNEPKIIVEQGFQRGSMAPGLKDKVASGKVLHHLGLAHGRAVQAFRSSGAAGRIGACPAVSTVYPVDASAAARKQVPARDVTENWLYLDPILAGRYPDLDGQDAQMVRGIRSVVKDGDLEIMSTPIDVLGLNYYSPTVVDGNGRAQTVYPVASNGWEQIYPDGLRDILVQLARRYRLPLVVCENGIPDDHGGSPRDDQGRIDYLRSHLAAVREAMAAGAGVQGFHVWSLLDNFEWARGYTQRWGLVRVDFKTQERTRKASADWYAEVMRTRTVPD